MLDVSVVKLVYITLIIYIIYSTGILYRNSSVFVYTEKTFSVVLESDTAFDL